MAPQVPRPPRPAEGSLESRLHASVGLTGGKPKPPPSAAPSAHTKLPAGNEPHKAPTAVARKAPVAGKIQSSTSPLRPMLLSLDGGGVKGLSTLRILERIMDQHNKLRAQRQLDPQRPGEVFDMIGGTSTGGYVLTIGPVRGAYWRLTRYPV
jgi:hypothetical protein